MNWGQFGGALCYLCLANCVVISCSLTQEIVGSNNIFLHKFSMKTFKEKSNEFIVSILPTVKLKEARLTPFQDRLLRKI